MSDNITKAAQDVKEKLRHAEETAAAKGGPHHDDKGKPHVAGLITGAVALTLSIAESLLFFTSCADCYWYTWYLMALALVAKGGAAAFASNLHQDPPSAPKRLLGSTDGLYMVLGAGIVMLFPNPTIFVTMGVLCHAVVDLVTVQRPALRQLAPQAETAIGGAVDAIPPQTMEMLRLVGGACEVVALFVLPFCGSFILCIAYVAFLLLRYRSDRQVRAVWGSIAAVTDKGAYHAAVPPAVGQNYTKAKEALYKASSAF